MVSNLVGAGHVDASMLENTGTRLSRLISFAECRLSQSASKIWSEAISWSCWTIKTPLTPRYPTWEPRGFTWPISPVTTH